MTKRIKHPRWLLVTLIGMVTLLPVLAGTTGSITGVVKDDTGAPVAGGKLTLVNTTMGRSIVATTDRKGSYGFPIVAPGTYTLHTEAKGFAPQDRSGLVVHVNSALRIDLTLEPEKAAQ